MTGPSDPPPVAKYLTAELAEQMSGGHLQLAAPRAPDDIPIISPDRARDLARAFLHSWGRETVSRWAWERGTPIDQGSITPGDRVYFARTPHGRLPDDLYHPAIRRIYGPMYLVPMVAGGETVALLAVSAYSTDLEIDAKGLIRSPFFGGSYFFSTAVAPNPRDKRFQFTPVTPEEAVAYAGRLTGAHVSALPELVLMPPFHPTSAQWRLTMDRPVQVRRRSVPGLTRRGEEVSGSEPAFATKELYVGPNRLVTVPARVQPAHKRVAYPVGQERGGNQPHVTTDLPRRDDLPLEFEAVVIQPEGR
jgi:hypothetical protein